MVVEIVFDIEANGLNEVTINTHPQPEVDKVWCLVTKNIESGEVRTFRQDQIAEGVDLLRSASKIIGHNIIAYDVAVLERFYGPIETTKVDTLVISRLMYPDRKNHPFGGNSLKSWGEYLGHNKLDYSLGFSEFNEDMIEYCIRDVEVTHEVYQSQQQFIKDNPRLLFTEHRVSEIISRQTENGIGFDLDAAEALEKELLMEKADINDSLCQEFEPIITERWSEKTGKRLKDKVEYFNPNSRQQIARRLYDKYGWVAPLTDKGNPKVDEAVLKTLTYPEARMLSRSFEIEKLHGMLSDWIARSNMSRDGRIHGSINPQGAVTGRMTASQPNLQQVSGNRKARSLFQPRPQWVQVGIDASGLEARLLANRMFEWDRGEYGNLVINGDIHTYNQKQAGLRCRDQSKTFFYALIYGAGNAKIGKIINKGVGAGGKLKKKFLENMPALKKLIENCEFQVAKKSTITLLDGREVPCRSAHSSLNVQVQGDGAVLMKYALCILDKELREKYLHRYEFMATVHDEWQIECEPEIAELVGQAGVNAIVTAGEYLKCKIPMDGEYRIGKSWADCH
jgi:DNA polymerase-1